MLPYSQNACHCRRRVARGADIMRARSSRPLSPGVVEGPRFLPPDPTAELVRRNNAAARVRPESIFMTGLSDKAFDTLTARLVSPAQTTRVSQLIPFRQLGRNIALLSLIDIVALSTPLHWSGPFACAVQRKLQIIDSAWYVRINRDERIAG